MCRSTDYHGFKSDRDRLKIRAFFVQFSGLQPKTPLPESLTLLYLPRINEHALEIDGSIIRPDSPAFVTLHRVISQERSTDVVFGSRARVRAGEGLRFEVYMSEEKVVKGVFRKDEEDEWWLECKCAMERELAGVEVKAAEFFVDVEGHVAMSEKMDMVVGKKRVRKGCGGLEEIPEERELDTQSDGCCCSCGEKREDASDGGQSEEDEEEEEEIQKDMEGVRWAVDVGIWVVCLGVGFLVSRASSKGLRPRRIF